MWGKAGKTGRRCPILLYKMFRGKQGGFKMKETKECYDFSGMRVCKVCGCKDKSCDCHTELEGERKKPL